MELDRLGAVVKTRDLGGQRKIESGAELRRPILGQMWLGWAWLVLAFWPVVVRELSCSGEKSVYEMNRSRGTQTKRKPAPESLGRIVGPGAEVTRSFVNPTLFCFSLSLSLFPLPFPPSLHFFSICLGPSN